jgi:hypothetical protein
MDGQSVLAVFIREYRLLPKTCVFSLIFISLCLMFLKWRSRNIQQHVLDNWRYCLKIYKGSTSTVISPTSASDLMGQHIKIGVINFGATLVVVINGTSLPVFSIIRFKTNTINNCSIINVYNLSCISWRLLPDLLLISIPRRHLLSADFSHRRNCYRQTSANDVTPGTAASYHTLAVLRRTTSDVSCALTLAAWSEWRIKLWGTTCRCVYLCRSKVATLNKRLIYNFKIRVLYRFVWARPRYYINKNLL